MKISRKLALGFVTVASLVAIAGFFGLVASRQIVNQFEGGDVPYRAIVSNSTAASRYAKDAQSGLVLYLMLNDPSDREEYRRGLTRLEESVDLLDRQVSIPKARLIVEAMKKDLAEFRAKGNDLLTRYDREVAAGGFLPRNHAVLFREMNQIGSSIRQSGVDLAAVETDFLNKQTAITAATLVSSFAKRAEGHLMLYLTLHNPEDREKFWNRQAALAEQVDILQERETDEEGKAILSNIRSGEERVIRVGNALLMAYDRDILAGGRFHPADHQDEIREFHLAATEVQLSGGRLADHNTRLEKEGKDRAVRHAKTIAYSVLLVAVVTLLLATTFGYFFSRHIAAPLKRLGDAATRIGKGDLDATIAADGNDEIGELSRSIRRMATDLKTTMVSRDHFENIVQSMNDCLAVVGLDGTVRIVNRSLCELLGFDPEELPGSPAARFFGEECGGLESARKELLEGGPFRSTEKTYRAKDGRDIAVLLSGALIRDSGGQPEAMVFVAKDIRRRKQAEEELRLSEERFRQLFEQTHEPILLFRQETDRIADANPAAVDLYGYSREEIVAGGPSLFVPPEDMEELSAAIRGIGTGRGFSIEKATHLRRGGERRFVSIRGIPIVLQTGRITYCTVRDITERIRMEEDARHQQANLIHSNRMASLGAVVSGVAHEVNNPNNAIMFSTPIILSAWQDAIGILDGHHRDQGDFQLAGLPYAEMRDAVSRMILGISDSSLRIRNIVGNLKSFARREDPTHSVVDVNEVVRSVVSILNHEIMKGTRRFRATYGGDRLDVLGSAAQLEQVLMNLILNSLQSLPDPERGVDVWTGVEPVTGTVEIRVRDEGAGIPPDVIGKITDPFFSTKHSSGGLGLGLSISRSIVEEHGGEMNFHSIVGCGTEAVITLPPARRADGIKASA